MKVPRLEKSSRPSSRASAVTLFAACRSSRQEAWCPFPAHRRPIKPWTTEIDSISGSSSRSILHELVDEGPHGVTGRRKDVDHPAIEDGHDGFHPAFERVNGDPPEVFGPVDEIGVRKFLEIDEEVRPPKAAWRSRWLCGSSSAKIKDIGPDDLAHAGKKVAFRIFVAGCHHRPVQAR